MISVLLVSHNTREHLENALEHLHRQQDTWYEVLVIDNASDDGSPEMVKEQYPDVRLIALEDNLGFGAANNRGAREAQGDALLLLNSDAWLADGALPRLAKTLEDDPRLGAVTPYLAYPDLRPQFAWAPETGVVGEALQKARNRFEGWPLVHRSPPRPLPFWLTAACLLVRRRAFESVEGFDEDFFLYFEDVDLCRRLRQEGWRLAVERRASAFHVKGASDRAGRAELEYRRSQLRYYRKHRPLWECRFLERRLRGKFEALPASDLRRRLLALLPGS